MALVLSPGASVPEPWWLPIPVGLSVQTTVLFSSPSVSVASAGDENVGARIHSDGCYGCRRLHPPPPAPSLGGHGDPVEEGVFFSLRV